jgi:hypothetical protein
MDHDIQILMGALAVLVGLGLIVAQLGAIYPRNQANSGRRRSLYPFNPADYLQSDRLSLRVGCRPVRRPASNATVLCSQTTHGD